MIHSIAGDLDERVHVVDFTRVELLNVLAPANMMTGSNCVRRGRMVLDSGGAVDVAVKIVGCVTLFTVTLCANPANDLTCPPSYSIYIF